MRRYHPREWEEDAACFGHDDKPETHALLRDLSKFIEPFKETEDPHRVYDPQSLSEVFYPPRVKEIYPVYAERAKDYCFGKDRRHPCPVRKQCLIWAILSEEEHGILGGMSHRERNALVRKAETEGISPVEYVERIPH